MHKSEAKYFLTDSLTPPLEVSAVRQLSTMFSNIFPSARTSDGMCFYSPLKCLSAAFLLQAYLIHRFSKPYLGPHVGKIDNRREATFRCHSVSAVPGLLRFYCLMCTADLWNGSTLLLCHHKLTCFAWTFYFLSVLTHFLCDAARFFHVQVCVKIFNKNSTSAWTMQNNFSIYLLCSPIATIFSAMITTKPGNVFQQKPTQASQWF